MELIGIIYPIVATPKPAIFPALRQASICIEVWLLLLRSVLVAFQSHPRICPWIRPKAGNRWRLIPLGHHGHYATMAYGLHMITYDYISANTPFIKLSPPSFTFNPNTPPRRRRGNRSPIQHLTHWPDKWKQKQTFCHTSRTYGVN
jgi:hypothetical protein